tara:strand:+ start:1607 stop:1948 length:342 start_codon:yes stop_codon:yes gene_type:complete
MLYLPNEIWVLIYEYEGLYYKYIEMVKQELDILSFKCICKTDGEGIYSTKYKKYHGVCPIHWGIWKYSIRNLKNKSLPEITLLPNGIWNWKNIFVPEWLLKLKRKIRQKKLKF